LDFREGRKLIEDVWGKLEHPGVYVLYRDDHPYYIGRANNLRNRIYSHANHPKDKHYNFWNHFSAFVVSSKEHLSDVEGILIAAIPTDNSALPRFKKVTFSSRVARWIHDIRMIPVTSSEKTKAEAQPAAPPRRLRRPDGRRRRG